MEAVPRLPMLSFQPKTCSDNVEFTPVLRSFILNHYGEQPSKYERAFEELESLRHSSTKCSKDLMSCDKLKKYYAQLFMLNSRFPMGESDPVAVAFTWTDVFSGKTVVHADVRFEQACILFNIGAISSYIASSDSRLTGDGLKASCTQFQLAAGAFQTISESFCSSYSTDFDEDILKFKYNLLLAQAQECILEKSMSENRKSTITAKISVQIVEFYKQCLRHLESPSLVKIVGSKKVKEWQKKVEIKQSFNKSITYYYCGIQAEEAEKWGERLTYFNAALEGIESCIKLAKDYKEMDETLAFASDIIIGKQKSANKDNDLIYHAKVPNLDDLPQVNGAVLVKGIIIDHTDPQISGPDIFRELIPFEAHEVSSIYSEEKAKLLRCIGTEIDDANNELNRCMKQLAIEEDLFNLNRQQLPDSVLEKCAAVSVRPNSASELQSCLQSLSETATRIEDKIRNAHNKLITEAKNEDVYVKKIGNRQHPSAKIFNDCREEIDKIGEKVEKASHSTQKLCGALDENLTNIKILSDVELTKKSLPNRAIIADSEDDVQIVNEMKRLLDKINEMVNQRKTFEQELRTAVLNDDITKVIASRDVGKQHNEFFKNELKKHDENITLLRKNIEAQKNIFKALEEIHVKFAPIKQEILDIDERRQEKIDSLVQSYEVYTDLKEKSINGIEFYESQEVIVNTLLERVEKAHNINEQERERILLQRGYKDSFNSNSIASKEIQPPQIPQKGSDIRIPNAGELCGETGMTFDEMRELGISPSSTGSGQKKTIKDNLSYMKKRNERRKDKTTTEIDNMNDVNISSTTSFNDSNVTLPDAITNVDRTSITGQQNYGIQNQYFIPATSNVSTIQTIGKRNLNYNMSYKEQADAAAAIAMFDQATSSKFLGGLPSTIPKFPQDFNSYKNLGQMSQTPQIPPKQTINTNIKLDNNQSSFPNVNLNQQQQQQPQNYQYQQIPATMNVNTQQQKQQQPQLPVQQPPQNNYMTSNLQNQQPQRYFSAAQQPQQQQQQQQHQEFRFSNPNQQQIPMNTNIQNYQFQQQQGYQNQGQRTSIDSIQSQQFEQQQQVYPNSDQRPSLDSIQSHQFQQQQPYSTSKISFNNISPVHNTQSISQSQPTIESNQQNILKINYNAQNTFNSMQYANPNTNIITGTNVQQQSQIAPTSVRNSSIQSTLSSYLPNDVDYYSSPSLQLSSQFGVGSNAANILANVNQFSQKSIAISSSIENVSKAKTEIVQSTNTPNLPNTVDSQTNLNNHSTVITQCISKPTMISEEVVDRRQLYNVNNNTQFGQISQQLANQFSGSLNLSTEHDFKNFSSTGYPNQQPALNYNQFVGIQQPSPLPQQQQYNLQQQQQRPLQQYQSQYPQQQQQQQQQMQQPQQNLQQQQQQQQQQAPLNYINQSQKILSHPQTLSISQQSINQTNSAFHRCSSKPKEIQTPQKSVLSPIERPSSTTSSLDDILSSSPLKVEEKILKPYCITDEEREKQREEEARRQELPKHDPYSDPNCLQRLAKEVENFEKMYDSFNTPTLSGSNVLDRDWKDIIDNQDRYSKEVKTAVARCYPMKNRFQDIMPYDDNRVVLKDSADDYINASTIGSLGPGCPLVIAAQAPLSSTINDFWTMISECGCEIIVQLNSNGTESGHKMPMYLPNKKGEKINYGSIQLTVHSVNDMENLSWTRRVLNLTNTKNRQTRTLIHFHFVNWPVCGQPTSTECLIKFIHDVDRFYMEQRSLLKPILVHCNSGCGRTGVFCAVYAALVQLNKGRGIINVNETVLNLRKKRKYMIDSKEQLKYLYKVILDYSSEILKKHGILLHHSFKKESFSSLNKTNIKVEKEKPLEKPVEKTIEIKEKNNLPTEEIIDNKTNEEITLPTDDKLINNIPSNSNLSNLQDPNNFTLTTDNQKRINKRNFGQSKGTLKEPSLRNPEDPLNSLDPLWSLK